MSLKKGEENLEVTTEPEKLSVADAGEITELMREAYPEFSSPFTAERVEEGFEAALLVGIRREGRLVAFGKAVKTPPVSLVAWIATLEGITGTGLARHPS